MINGIDPNGDINQEQAKLSMGITPANKWNGKNYANAVNMKARERLARYRRSMRVMDGIQAINRFTWSNCPVGLRSALMERVLYYRGQGMFYYDDVLKKFLFLPYALTSETDQHIDMYGQFQTVKPYTFNGKAENSKKGNGQRSAKDVYLGLITRVPVYDLEELEMTIATKGLEWCQNNCCIIIRDYTQQLSEYTEPRSITQEAWIETQAEIPIFFRTAMLKALTPKLLKVSDQGVMDVVLAELQSIEDSIIEGKTIIPVTSMLDVQDIDTATNVDRLVETTLKAYDSIDSVRRAHLGIDTNGAFQKQSGMGEGEQLGSDVPNLIKTDALNNRQFGSDMIRKLWPELKMYVNESAGMNEVHAEKDEQEEGEEMAEVDSGKTQEVIQ
jgi:hypothetical protein